MGLLMVLGVANTALPAVVLTRGVSSGLARTFPIFFIYMALSVVTGTALLSAAGFAGMTSAVYSWTWRITGALVQVAEFAVIVELLRYLSGLSVRILGVTVLVSVAFVFLTLVDLAGADRLATQVAVGCALQLGAWATLVHFLIVHREIELSSNVRGILCGLFVMFGIQWMVFTNHLRGFLSYEVFGVLTTLATTAAFLVFLFSLWEPDGAKRALR